MQKAGRSDEAGLSAFLNKYLLLPLRAGLYGFAAVFTIILFIELSEFIFSNEAAFSTDKTDLMTAATGFVLAFVLSLLKNIIRRG